MKKYAIFFSVLGFLAFSFPYIHAAHAATVAGDISIDSVSKDAPGNLVITWHRIPTGSMNQEAIGILVNATSTLSPFVQGGSRSTPASLSTGGLVGAWSPTNGACAPGFDSYSGSATTTGGNVSSLNQVVDGNTGNGVPAASLSHDSVLYLTLVSIGASPCSPAGLGYEDSMQIVIPLTPTFATSSLQQYKFDGTTPIIKQGFTTENAVAFSVVPQLPLNDPLQLQVETEPLNTSFSNVPTAVSNPVFSGQTASVLVSGLADGPYHWQARVVDATGNIPASPWQPFSSPGNVDFYIEHIPPRPGVIYSNPSLTSSAPQCGPGPTQNLGFIAAVPGSVVTTFTFASAGASNGGGGASYAIYSDPSYSNLVQSGLITFFPNGNTANLATPIVGNLPSGYWQILTGANCSPFLSSAGWQGLTIDQELAPGIPASLGQFALDGTTPIVEGGVTTQHTVVFGATMATSTSNDLLQLQLEVQRSNVSFTNSPTVTASSSAGQTARITVPGLMNGSYHWQVRAFDTVTNALSNWQEFGTAGNIDFMIVASGSALYDERGITASPATPSYGVNYILGQTGGGGDGSFLIDIGAMSSTIPRGTPLYYSGNFIVDCATINCAAHNPGAVKWDLDAAPGVDAANTFPIPYPANGTTTGFVFATGTVSFPYDWTVGTDLWLQMYTSFGIGMSTTTASGVGIPWSNHSTFTVGNGLADFCLSTDPTVCSSTSQKEPVVIVPGVFGSVFKSGQWILQPVFQPYDSLKATLVANGYVQNQTLFDFPYDWEKTGIPALAQQLKDKIQAIKAICSCSKVNLVAHSMGGLVARQYIESNLYQGDVDQLIFLGTPQLGASGDYLAWEGGTPGFRNNFDFEDIYLQSVIYQQAIEAGFPLADPSHVNVDIFNYIHSSSSPVLAFQELLPTYNYLRDISDSTLRTYPTGYPQNSFLDALNSPASLTLLQQSGVTITTMYSNDQTDTPNIIDVKNDISTLPLWSDGVFQSAEFSSGDGTVLQGSALAVGANNAIEIGGKHQDLPTTADGKIVQILAGITNPVIVSPPSSIQKFLSVFGLSPINILITAPDGSKIGKDFSTGQEVNQINGAFYSGPNTSGENVFIPNPEDGQYTIATQGTGSGAYHVLASYGYEASSSATSSDVMFGGNTQPGLTETLNLTINSSTPTSNAIVPQDATPPVISHSALNGQYLINASSAQFTYSAVDSGVGLFSVTSTLDGIPLSSGAAISFNQPGNHAIIITAQDFVGNITSTTLNYNVSYQFSGFQPPIKTDGSGIYNLGRTLPIKFNLTDANGNPTTSAVARLVVTNVQNGIVGTVPVTLATSTNDIGNFFRVSGSQYIYNFDTGQLTAGTWQIKAVLDDGNSYTVLISLR